MKNNVIFVKSYWNWWGGCKNTSLAETNSKGNSGTTSPSAGMGSGMGMTS